MKQNIYGIILILFFLNSNAFALDILFKDIDIVDNNLEKLFIDREFYKHNIAYKEHTIVDKNGSIYISEVKFGDKEKIFLKFRRWYSWKGEIYSVYLCNPKELDEQIEKIIKKDQSEELKCVYPCESLNATTQENGWSWFNNEIFEYNNKYFYTDYNNSDNGNNVIFNLYNINDNGDIRIVLTIKTSKSFDELYSENKLPAFWAFHHSLMSLFGQNYYKCNGINNYYLMLSNGNINTRKILLEPNKNKALLDKKKHSAIDTLLFYWSLQDIWNYREKSVYEYNIKPAIYELKNFYLNENDIDETQAEKIAEFNVENLINSYFLPAYYYYDDKYAKQNIYMKEEKINNRRINYKIIEGEIQTSDDINNLLDSLPENFDIFEISTLLIDNYDLLSIIIRKYGYDNLVNDFNKNLLMYAVHMNNYETVEKLISNGFPINSYTKAINIDHCYNLPNRLNKNALMYAVENSSIEIIKILVKKGADIEVKDSQGNDIYYYLKRNPRFSNQEKQLKLNELLDKYSKNFFRFSSDNKNFNKDIQINIQKSNTLSIFYRDIEKAYKELIDMSTQTEFDRNDNIIWIENVNKLSNQYPDENQLKLKLIQNFRARLKYLYNRVHFHNKDF